MSRVHSTHANTDWSNETFPQYAFINPIDAKIRGITDGEEIKIFNERGAMIIICRLTERILPGVIDIPQGAWWNPDENGIDRGGSINVLTSERWTPLAFGSAQQTVMVQAAKAAE